MRTSIPKSPLRILQLLSSRIVRVGFSQSVWKNRNLGTIPRLLPTLFLADSGYGIGTHKCQSGQNPTD